MNAVALVQTEKGRRDAYRIALGTLGNVRRILQEHRLDPLVANRLQLVGNGLARLVELTALEEQP